MVRSAVLQQGRLQGAVQDPKCRNGLLRKQGRLNAAGSERDAICSGRCGLSVVWRRDICYRLEGSLVTGLFSQCPKEQERIDDRHGTGCRPGWLTSGGRILWFVPALAWPMDPNFRSRIRW